jgi:ferredoxin
LNSFYANAIIQSSNAESFKEVILMAYKITDECIACGACKDECPVEAISEGDIYVIDAEACIDCGACAGACPVDAPVEE